MRSRFFTTAAIAALLLSVIGSGFGDTPRAKGKKGQANALVHLLPASDAVIGLDARRFFSEALPQVLASNQPMLTKVMSHLDEMQAKTGLDLRKFDSVAIGLSVRMAKAKDLDIDPVAIARGDVKAGGLVAITKLASNGTYREERFGDRTIYVFSAKSAKNAIQQTAAKSGGPAADDMIDRALKGLSNEIAVTALDANTIAFGSLARVRSTVEATTRVSAELTTLLAGKENAVASFAMRSPNGMSGLLPLDNDELGANIDSIRFVSGSVDVLPSGTSLKVTAQTLKPEQAKGLTETLEGLQMLGKAFLGGSKRADQRLYAKLIDNAEITRVGNNVSLALLIEQADLDTLVASIK